jgi:uncharacterized membrane protein YsdA (DUF1294 family)
MAKAKSKHRSKRRGLGVAGYLGLASVAAVVPLVLARELIAGYEHLAWIAAWSVVTFVAYAIDKRAARKQAARINERALHLFALLGGFVGGWIGRHVLRHKTQKSVFGVVLGVATVLHGVGLAVGLAAARGLW